MKITFWLKPKAGLTKALAEQGHSASKCLNQIQGGS
jgi:hypothetical protein